MHRKGRFVFILLFLLLACGVDEFSEESTSHPNIIFISIDDLRPTLGAYGDSIVLSPNMDAFANEGFTFRNAFCQSAVCAPSRASLMTGLRPDSTRVWHLGDKFRELHPDIITMPQYFHEYGYYTVNIGKIFHNYMPDSVSWDEADLRPKQYLKAEWLKRDGETFYVNAETNRKQKIKRDSLVKLRPNYYADGWNNGPAWEMEDVHDTLYYDGAQNELAKRALTRLSKQDRPFYLALGYFRPHLPFAVPKKYWDLYDRNSIPMAVSSQLPEAAPVFTMNSMYELRGYDGFSHLLHPSLNSISEDTARTLKHGYYASVSYVDALLGDLFNHLKTLGIYDNSIIIIWGDHGWKLGEHKSWCKQTNYDIDIHVPLMIRYPNQHNKGKETLAIVELVDIFPSLCELAGIEIPSHMQGNSFVPLFEDPHRDWKKAAFSQFHRRPKVTPDGKRYMGYSIRRADYHYIEWYYWDNVKGEKGEFVDSELYNLLKDPDENFNVAHSESYTSVITELSDQLELGWKGMIDQIE